MSTHDMKFVDAVIKGVQETNQRLGRVQVNVWMEPELRHALRREAKARGVSLGKLVRMSFEALLAQETREAEARSIEERVAALERLAGESY